MLKIARGLQRSGDICAVIAPRDSRWPDVCRREGFAFDGFTFGLEWAPHRMGQLAGLLHWHRPDVVLCADFREARRVRYVTRRPAIGVKLPLLHDLTDVLLDRLSFRYAVDRLFTDHRSARRLLLRQPWVPPGKILLVPNGVETDPGGPDPARRAAARAVLGASDPGLVVIGVACRFTAEKRVMDALRVFRLADAGDRALLILIGDGPQRAELMRAARPLGDRVRFLGWRDDAPELLRGCDVVLHTGASDAMPNSVLEGMAAGASVISTRAGGASEIVTSGRDGFLFDSGDVQGMAECLRELLADPRKRARIGVAAVRRAESFSIDTVVRRIRDGMAAVAEARRQLWPKTRRGPRGVRWVARNDYDGPCDDRIFTDDGPEPLSSLSPAGRGRVRRYPPRGGLGAFADFLSGPRARRLYRTAHRLELIGVPVAPHRAALWRREGWIRNRSALILGEVAGATPAPEWAARHADLPEIMRLFAASAGAWLAGLHALRVLPTRLDAEKIFVRLGGAIRPEFILDDLDTCRICLFLTPRAAARNFARLHGVFAGLLSPRHMLRFAAAYRRTRGLSRRTLRRLLRGIPV